MGSFSLARRLMVNGPKSIDSVAPVLNATQARRHLFLFSRNGKLTLKSLMLDQDTTSSLDVFLDYLASDGSHTTRAQFLNSIGSLMLILNGFDFDRNFAPPAVRGLAKQTDAWLRITPTWKPISAGRFGTLNFDSKASGANAVQTMSIGFSGNTVAELADFLESTYSVRAEDFDAQQVRMMFQWSLQPVSAWVSSSALNIQMQAAMIFAFSFSEAGDDCQDSSLANCKHPGRSNAILADAVLDYLRGSRESQAVCQWEIFTAIRLACSPAEWSQIEERVHSVGIPGEFKNSVEIAKIMMSTTLNATQSSIPSHAVVLAHPDHLPRAYITVRSTVAASTLKESFADVDIIPAIFPYDLGWPRDASTDDKALNMFQKSSIFVGTGFAENTTGDGDQGLGYFTEGGQRWTHDRRNFLLYEFWARAKGFAMHDLTQPETWSEKYPNATHESNWTVASYVGIAFSLVFAVIFTFVIWRLRSAARPITPRADVELERTRGHSAPSRSS